MPGRGKSFDEVASDPGSARHRVLVALRDLGPLTRADIARRTGLSPATISSLSRDLLADGTVVDVGPVAGAGPRTGPPGTGLAINPGLAHALGVDVGFRTLRVVLSDVHGRELAYDEARVPPDHTAAAGLPVLRRLAASVLDRAGCAPATVVAAGVALRSPVDVDRQRVAASGEMPGWAGVTAADLADPLGCPVMLGNDANLAALGEHVYGAGRGLSSTLTVKLHSGVGAGVVVGDRLVTGLHGGAGELGHVRVPGGGTVCRCGKTGCLDTRASIPAVLARLAVDGSVPSMAEVLHRVAEDDAAAVAVVREAGGLVGGAVAAACLLLAPEAVVVVGALARAGAVVLEPIREALAAEAVPGTGTAPELRLGELGDRPTVLGALAMALESYGWRAAGARGVRSAGR